MLFITVFSNKMERMRYQNRNEVAKSHSFKQDFDTSLFLDQNHLIRLNHTNVPAEMAADSSTMNKNAWGNESRWMSTFMP